MDNYNNVVKVVRDDPSLQRNVGTLKQEAAAGGDDQGRRGLQRRRRASRRRSPTSELLASRPTRARCSRRSDAGDELVVIGEVKDGFINVQGANGERLGQGDPRREAAVAPGPGLDRPRPRLRFGAS